MKLPDSTAYPQKGAKHELKNHQTVRGISGAAIRAYPKNFDYRKLMESAIDEKYNLAN